jgi:hypothetical protein
MISGLRIVVALLMVAALLVGCSGEIRMRKLTDQAVNDTEHPIRGVLVYQPAFFIEQSVKTTLVVNGKPAGSANDTPAACTPVPSERVVALPDLRNPYAISYHAGLFDKNTMGVVLNSSMVQAVNAAPAPAPSSSSSSGNSFTSALAALPPIPTPFGIISNPNAGGISTPGSPITTIQQRQPSRSSLAACTDGPMIVGYRRLELP